MSANPTDTRPEGTQPHDFTQGFVGLSPSSSHPARRTRSGFPDLFYLFFSHVVNERHLKRRTRIFTTNKPLKQWGRVLHDDDLGDAIVDRVIERGRVLKLDGPSVRSKHVDPADFEDDSQRQKFPE